jgi:hypothetical protein
MILNRGIPFLSMTLALTCADLSHAGDLRGFTWNTKADLFGYYMPSPEIRFGKFVLDNFAVGDPSSFRDFAAGKLKGQPYAPVMFAFSDTTSPKVHGETCDTYKNTPRVLPAAYALSGNALRFVGTDKQIGVVAFTGTLNLKAVKAAQNAQSTGSAAPDAPVLKGDLSIGGKTYKNVTFTWFGGD